MGSKFADSAENNGKKIQNITRRMSKAEDDFEEIVERIMEAPPGSLNLKGLSIMSPRKAKPKAIPTTTG
ncbi:MAG: hypothetical protein OEY49_11840, partial [Candidatus Heimdallarchaeota archaeon]|nr:hypothetical protein [Candidatus Heimdallarchaeota archaeon]